MVGDGKSASAPPLSCLRCKQKKIRCNRAVPCDRCVAVGATCAPMKRMARNAARKKERAMFQALNSQIGMLERALQHDSAQAAGMPQTSNTTSPQAKNEKNGWVAEKARAVRQYSIKTLEQPEDLDTDSPISDVFATLDAALTDLGSPTSNVTKADFRKVLSTEEAKEAVRKALKYMDGEFMTGLLDWEVMTTIADIISSPLVNVEPVAKVVYFCLVFHGYIVGGYQSPTIARLLYLQCIQAIPQWQTSTAARTTMDVIAANLMNYTTIMNFDYHFAWKFHALACRYAKELGMQHLDLLSSKGDKAPRELNVHRYAFWQLVLSDALYRLCYDKPSELLSEASIDFVNFPSLIEPAKCSPKMIPTVTMIVWGRILFIVKEFLELLDEALKSPGGKESSVFQERVEGLVEQIPSLLIDWNIQTLMRSSPQDDFKGWLYGDIIVGAYNCIIQIERLRSNQEVHIISERSLSASRVVLDTIAECFTSYGRGQGGLYLYFIAFYPFHALFTMHYHILGTNDASNCEADTKRLDLLCTLMQQAARTYFEYIPIYRTISALNEVTKHVQSSRMSKVLQPEQLVPEPPIADGNPLLNEDMNRDLMGQDRGDCDFDSAQPNLAHFLPAYNGIQVHSMEDVQQIAGTQAFDWPQYMSEIETHFFERNWNDDWWNESLEANEPLIEDDPSIQ